MKKDLIENLSIFLLRNGFTVKCLGRACFDILARNDSKTLIIRVVEDANTLSRENILELQRISGYVGTAIVVSDKAGYNLEDNIVYTRFSVTTLNLKTFMNAISNKAPILQSGKAGLTATIRSDKFKENRLSLGYSLNKLARIIGVSRKMIQVYDNNDSRITLKHAIRMHEIFGDSIFRAINIFNTDKDFYIQHSSDIARKYDELGFHTLETRKVPFDVIARKDRDLILTEISNKNSSNLHAISKLFDASNLVIFDDSRPKDCVALQKEEFLEIDSANDLIKIVKEL